MALAKLPKLIFAMGSAFLVVGVAGTYYVAKNFPAPWDDPENSWTVVSSTRKETSMRCALSTARRDETH